MQGKASTLTWQQATQNFAISNTTVTPAALTGNYQGAFVGTATGCGGGNGSFSMNNVQYAMTQTGSSLTMILTFPGSTPSSCTLNGTLQFNLGGAQHSIPSGNYTCNDGTSGMWNASGLGFNGGGFSGQSTLTATNGCTSKVKLAGARTS